MTKQDIDQLIDEVGIAKSAKSDAEIEAFESVTRDEDRLREYVRSHPPGMVGSGQRELARFLDRYPPNAEQVPTWRWRGSVQEAHCRNEFVADTMWELHLDPYGNLQTNCGIILGRVPEITPAELLAAGPERANRFVRTLCETGAVGLADLAHSEYGFEYPETVAQTCELCYLTRTFLRPFHPEVFGPSEVYTPAAPA